MSTIDMTPRLRLAAEYIKEHGWTTGTEQNEIGQVCLTGAVKLCAPQNGDEHIIREVLRKRNRAEGWNDSNATEDQVVDYLATAEISDADLLDTFGPQWLQTVELVRTLAGLTAEQTTRLDATWSAAWSAAWYAARSAAVALSVRDLIGQHSFTQTHYNILTEHWRTVVGKVHPNDVDLQVSETGDTA